MAPDSGGREAILDTAAQLFSQKGYKGVSIRDIAQACGVTNAALYYHFKNKDDLYLAVLRRNHESVARTLAEAAGPAGDVRVRLKRLVLCYADVMHGQRQSFQTVRRDLAHVDDARAGRLLAEMHAEFLRPIQQAIESGQTEGRIVSGDARFFARLLHGMLVALTLESKSNRRMRVTEQEVELLLSVFLDGVGK